MKLNPKISSLLLGILLPATSSANITIYPMSLKITPSTTSKNKFKIYSKSDQLQRVTVSVRKIINPATADEDEIPAPATDTQSLIASPQSVLLPAGGEQTITLRTISTPEKEALYRVFVKPAPADPSANEEEQNASVTSLTRGVLVYSLPQDPTSNLTLDLKSARVENTGNIHVWIKDIATCSDHSEDHCKKTYIGTSVFPGSSLPVPTSILPVKGIVVNYQTHDTDMKSRRWDF